jgi:hypothetical protein
MLLFLSMRKLYGPYLKDGFHARTQRTALDNCSAHGDHGGHLAPLTKTPFRSRLNEAFCSTLVTLSFRGGLV